MYTKLDDEVLGGYHWEHWKLDDASAGASLYRSEKERNLLSCNVNQIDWAKFQKGRLGLQTCAFFDKSRSSDEIHICDLLTTL